MPEAPDDINGQLTRLEVELRKLEGEYNMDFARRPWWYDPVTGRAVRADSFVDDCPDGTSQSFRIAVRV